jgi:hypothetical protein
MPFPCVPILVTRTRFSVSMRCMRGTPVSANSFVTAPLFGLEERLTFLLKRRYWGCQDSGTSLGTKRGQTPYKTVLLHTRKCKKSQLHSVSGVIRWFKVQILAGPFFVCKELGPSPPARDELLGLPTRRESLCLQRPVSEQPAVRGRGTPFTDSRGCHASTQR